MLLISISSYQFLIMFVYVTLRYVCQQRISYFFLQSVFSIPFFGGKKPPSLALPLQKNKNWQPRRHELHSGHFHNVNRKEALKIKSNQLTQLCYQSPNTTLFPHVHTDINSEYGTIIIIDLPEFINSDRLQKCCSGPKMKRRYGEVIRREWNVFWQVTGEDLKVSSSTDPYLTQTEVLLQGEGRNSSGRYKYH